MQVMCRTGQIVSKSKSHRFRDTEERLYHHFLYHPIYMPFSCNLTRLFCILTLLSDTAPSHFVLVICIYLGIYKTSTMNHSLRSVAFNGMLGLSFP
jgi:hypothetical protein